MSTAYGNKPVLEGAVTVNMDSAGEAIREGATVVKDKVIEGYETAKHKVSEGYEAVSHKVHDVIDKAADTSLKDAKDSVSGFVKANPGKSLLVAAGAGLILGVILRGRLS